ncbi:major facilitator superfamily domain-containing protein 6-like isoform X2 [Diorhabda sublineata]|uniref:major facilitator superfamily domain-containing protein 6-like isoform X2 n=1 Tax=Diorhabda sublineata TaxID=1163346 RepID=UPI0024E14CAF|nr:major facilitator superfamily domain-containing protein 6-like isoform X2 [Diorhabda sublineata]
MKCTINKKLVPMKAHYFLFNAGSGPVTPYLSIYARQLGFSSIVVGFMYTILPIFGMVAKPIFGTIADKFRCQKRLFLAAQILTAIAFLVIFYSPKIHTTRIVNFSCYNDTIGFFSNSSINKCTLDDLLRQNTSNMCKMTCGVIDQSLLCNKWNISDHCGHDPPTTLSFTALTPTYKIQLTNTSLFFEIANIKLNNERILTPSCSNGSPLSTCHINCDDYNINSLITETSIDDSDAYRSYQFWCLLTFMIIAWIGQATVVSIGDAICFQLLGDKHNSYGYQRLWGSLGWGLIAVVTGALIDVLSKGRAQKNYTSAFYTAAAFLITDFLVSLQIKHTQNSVSTNLFRDVGALLLNIRIVVFLIWCVSIGMCTGLMWQFEFWLIEDLAKIQGCSATAHVKTLEGLVQAIQTIIGETPFFFLSGIIMKKITHVHTMSLVLFAIGIRFILYSVIPNPWYFLPVEVSQGLTFGLFFACMTSYASIIAPVGLEATIQGLVGAVFEGVGVSAGSSLGGYLYKKVGGPLTFRYFGFAALIICVIHVLVQRLLQELNGAKYSTSEKSKSFNFNPQQPPHAPPSTSGE